MIGDTNPQVTPSDVTPVFNTKRSSSDVRKTSQLSAKELVDKFGDQMDSTGRITLSRHESAALQRNLARKEQKIKRLWKIVLLSGLGIVGLIVVTVLSNVLANEVTHVSKGTDVDGNQLKNIDGVAVQTEVSRSFTTIFDLPKFHALTLAKVDDITVRLKDDKGKPFEATFKISGVLKSSTSNKATFYTVDGSEILIDGDERLASIDIKGKNYLVDGEKERRMLSEIGREATPRLYTAQEFFTAEMGFEEGTRRHLSATSDLVGYGAVALAAASELLDYHNDKTAPEGTEYSTMHLTGSIKPKGKSRSFPVEIYFTKEPDASQGEGSRVSISDGKLASVQDFGVGFVFTSKGGSLQKCEAMNDLQDVYDKALSAINGIAVEDGGALIRVAGAVIKVDSVDFDVAKESVSTPSPDDCKGLQPVPGAAGIENPECNDGDVDCKPAAFDENGRRLEHGRQLWGGSATDLELWNVAYASYKGEAMPSGWTHWATCETGNAYARFIYKYPVIVVGFAGTSGLTDFGDWSDNLDTDIRNTNGIRNHEGFIEYMEKVKNCVNNYRNMLSGWGIPLSYVVGHSLGGAAATVYSQHHGDSTHGVRTFGAPVTRNGASCSVKGKRWAHEKDAVASNAMGVMGNFNHDVQNAGKMYETSSCTSDCWLGCCPWGWSSTKTTSTYSSNACSTKSGGCSYLFDCAYYFGTVHSAYGEYL